MPNYAKDQLWKLYEKLPPILKDTIFSVETANSIGEICKKNEIDEEKTSKIAEYVGYVLLGLLPPPNFLTSLETEIGLKKEVAKQVDHDVFRFIFWPVKEVLTTLYKTGEFISEKTPETYVPEPRVSKEKPKKKDVYREPTE